MDPGWYPDPDAPGMVLWWDGERWGDMRMPAALLPPEPSRTALVMEGLGSVAKLIFALLFFAIMLAICWVVFSL